MSFPTKEERLKCWGTRDTYWQCLDEHKIVDSVKDGPCAEFRKMYEKSCSVQWVKHFDRKRSYLQYKHKIETEGIPNKTVADTKIWAKRRVYAELIT